MLRMHAPKQAQVMSEEAALALLGGERRAKAAQPVMFFGTHEFAWIAPPDLASWAEGCRGRFFKKARSRKPFLAGVQEVRRLRPALCAPLSAPCSFLRLHHTHAACFATRTSMQKTPCRQGTLVVAWLSNNSVHDGRGLASASVVHLKCQDMWSRGPAVCRPMISCTPRAPRTTGGTARRPPRRSRRSARAPPLLGPPTPTRRRPPP
jgi:hypothetical protein